MYRDAIKGLEPVEVWELFYRISQIPRESGNEEGVRNYILEFANDNGVEAETDGVGNVILRKPATPGYEKRPVVILQGHLDMVCEKNRGTDHDFKKDPIRLVRNGDWISADGTTLGADNGIAIAMAMAAMVGDFPHGPLEALFTVDEETGLVGAMELDTSKLSGKIMLNIDSEEEEILFIGCAGGVNTEGALPVSREGTPPGLKAFQLSVTGLQGGHSGSEIHVGLGNALLISMRILRKLMEAIDIRLAGVEGGGKHNAIPRECFAEFVIAPDDLPAARKIVEENAAGFINDFSDLEPALKIELNDSDSLPESVLDSTSGRKVVDLVYSMPHGVIAMSREMEGLVETSTNLAAIKLMEDHLYVLTSQRATSNFMRDDIRDRTMACFTSAGGTSSWNNIYPGWKPDLSSSILKISKAAYERTFMRKPEIKAIHAGLECGVIGDKIPGIDMISFGSDIRMAHTPEEKMSASSLERIWNFFKEVLKSV